METFPASISRNGFAFEHLLLVRIGAPAHRTADEVKTVVIEQHDKLCLADVGRWLRPGERGWRREGRCVDAHGFSILNYLAVVPGSMDQPRERCELRLEKSDK